MSFIENKHFCTDVFSRRLIKWALKKNKYKFFNPDQQELQETKLTDEYDLCYDFWGNYSSFNFCFPEKLSSYTMTYDKLIKYTFVNKDDTFIFLSI